MKESERADIAKAFVLLHVQTCCYGFFRYAISGVTS